MGLKGPSNQNSQPIGGPLGAVEPIGLDVDLLVPTSGERRPAGLKDYDLSPRAMRDRRIAVAVKDEALRVTNKGRRFIEPLDLSVIVARIPTRQDPVMRDRSVAWGVKEAIQHALPGGWEYSLDADRAALTEMDHLAILQRIGI